MCASYMANHPYENLARSPIFKQQNWLQLRRAPIKFGRFIKLYNINDKVLYKQTDMGFAAEAGFFGGGKGAVFPPQKGVMLHPQVTDFREKTPPQAQYVL